LGIPAKDGVQCVVVALAATRMNIGPNDEPEGARRAPLREMLRLSANLGIPDDARMIVGFQQSPKCVAEPFCESILATPN